MTRCDLKKGYAFITYEDQDAAEDATDALQGKDILGSEIVIEKAKARNSGILQQFPNEKERKDGVWMRKKFKKVLFVYL